MKVFIIYWFLYDRDLRQEIVNLDQDQRNMQHINLLFLFIKLMKSVPDSILLYLPHWENFPIQS